MKLKTSKLRKLEKNRFSILTNNMEQCFICQKSPVDIHEIYGGSKRKTSMKNGFCIPLCRQHHIVVTDSKILSDIYKKLCQREFEKKHSREEFMQIVNKNYL